MVENSQSEISVRVGTNQFKYLLYTCVTLQTQLPSDNSKTFYY